MVPENLYKILEKSVAQGMKHTLANLERVATA